MMLPRVIFLVFFVLLAVAGWFFPRDYVYRGAPDASAWRDLRLWSFLLMLLLIVIYQIF